MGSYAAALTSTAGPMLDGEQLVAATKCMVEGHAKRKGLSGGGFGVIGALTTMSGSKDGHAIGEEALPKELALGLSPTRLFVFALSKMTGKAVGPPRAVVPLDQVTGVATRTKKTFGRRQLVLDVSFTDGSAISVETVQGKYYEEGQSLADRLSASIASSG